MDDAIISVEMMVVKMEEGFERVKAASFAYTSTAMPMLTGTIVAAAGFLPIRPRALHGRIHLLHLRGRHHGAAGLWFVSVVFVPYLGYKLLPDFKKKAGTHAGKRRTAGLSTRASASRDLRGR